AASPPRADTDSAEPRGDSECDVVYERLSQQLRLNRLSANASPHLLLSVPTGRREVFTVAVCGTSSLPFTSFAQLATGVQPNVALPLTSGQGKSTRHCSATLMYRHELISYRPWAG